MPEQTKGYKTTEFWGLVAASLVSILNSSGALHFHIPEDTAQNILNAGIAYAGSRSVLKAVTAYAAGALKTPKAGAYNQ